MRKSILSKSVFVLCAISLINCTKKNDVIKQDVSLSVEEKLMIKNAGFNGNWAEKTAEGDYLIEGDILLSKTQLLEMKSEPTTNNFIVANEEHYRTHNLVTYSYGRKRAISVRLANGFPARYSTALNSALARFNRLNISLVFNRVSTGGNIVITAANLGNSASGCTLGRAGGFPSNGNPGPGFVMSTNPCATSNLNTVAKVDEVMAHEIGHCIGFRHTDYANRASCGRSAVGENDYWYNFWNGANHIAGSPTNVGGTYNSWMMACTNLNPSFSASDIKAIEYVY